MSFRQVIISTLIIGLFIISMYYFAAGIADENNLNTSISDDPYMNKAFGNISKSLNTSSELADSQQRALILETEHPLLSLTGFVFTSILSAVGVFLNSTKSIFNITIGFVTERLGISPIVSGTILAILTIFLILSIWRVVRAGE